MGLAWSAISWGEVGTQAAARPVIEKRDDLQRHAYLLEIPVVDLYLPEHRSTLLSLAFVRGPCSDVVFL